VLTLPATSGTVVTTATSTGISGSAITTGTVGVSVGGTGANTLTANNVILGNGTSAVQFVAPGSNGNLLTSNGTTWTSAAAPAGGVTSLNGQTGAITNTDYGVIGSYIVAASNTQTSGDYSTNTTIAGSTLSVSNVTGGSTGLSGSSGTTNVGASNITNLGLSGTWRQMSRSWSGASIGVNLWVRIS